jgi:DNA repair protein RadC
MTERRDDAFQAYLDEIVRRDRENIPSQTLEVAAVREAVNARAPKAKKREKVSNNWTYHEQFLNLQTLLSWRIGEARAGEISAELMYEFGSLPNVLSASTYRLSNVPGVGEKTIATLRTVQELAEKMAYAPLEESRSVLTSWSELTSYLRIKTAFSEVERFHILFLDKKNRLIRDETQHSGTIDHVSAYPREVLRRCIELGAASIILCHNHPTGDPAPSTADLTTTRRIDTASREMGIILHDHVIVGKNKCVSLRGLGLI